MARITVEDCEKVVKNRFDLVVLAAQRTRQILAGDPVTVDENDEKKPVIALREIAAKTVSPEALEEEAVNRFRSFVPSDDFDDDLDDFSEDDTYNPYTGIELKAIEKEDDIKIVEDSELDAKEDL